LLPFFIYSTSLYVCFFDLFELSLPSFVSFSLLVPLLQADIINTVTNNITINFHTFIELSPSPLINSKTKTFKSQISITLHILYHFNILNNVNSELLFIKKDRNSYQLQD